MCFETITRLLPIRLTRQFDHCQKKNGGALAAHRLDITMEVSDQSMVLLDQHIEKGIGWAQSSKADLTVYQKLMAAYLYIPAFSDHALHILLKAWIRGELRCMSNGPARSNPSTLFGGSSFSAERLTGRGYKASFLPPIFDVALVCRRAVVGSFLK